MSVKLKAITVHLLREIISYSLDDLSDWISITGSNSSGKSSFLFALSLLSLDRDRDMRDVPVLSNRTNINPRQLTQSIEYLFELDTNLSEILDSKAFFYNFKHYFEELIEQKKALIKKHTNPSVIKDIRNDIDILQSYIGTVMRDGPFSKLFLDSLYETLRERANHCGGYADYKPAISSREIFMRPSEIFDLSKYLQITFDFDEDSGPVHSFILLDKDRNKILSGELFNFWLRKLEIIYDSIFFGLILGKTFFKGVIGNEPLNDSQSITRLNDVGSNLEGFIEYLMITKPDNFVKIKSNFEKIFNEKIEFKKGFLNQSDPHERILTKLRDKWTAVENLADGMKRVLRILIQLEEAKGYILLIDEPELHLHPEASKGLRNILFEYKKEVQIICATHSTHFIDPYYIDTLILNRRTNAELTSEVLSTNEIEEALNEIGSSGLDSLFSEVIIWVEGPYDVPYINRFLDLFADKIANNYRTKISIHPVFGNKNMFVHIDFEKIKKINRKGIFVLDSDFTSATATLTPEKTDFKVRCEAAGFQCWITNRREIENYIPPEILLMEFNLPPTTNIGKYDDIKQLVSRRKKDIARLTSNHITKQSIINNREIHEEIIEFIEKINEVIT